MLIVFSVSHMSRTGPRVWSPNGTRVLLSPPHPELLHQVHVGPLVLLHATLGDAGHVGRQRSIDEHTEHVQHRGEQLAATERDTRYESVDHDLDFWIKRYPN